MNTQRLALESLRQERYKIPHTLRWKIGKQDPELDDPEVKDAD